MLLQGLLEVVSSSAEFETIPIRRHEEALLRRIYEREVPVKLDRVDFEAPHFKTLQAHFFRIQSPADLAAGQILVLEKVLNCVDVMSSNAWLNGLRATDLSQMCVQAMWETDSPLKQVPHFDDDLIKRCKAVSIESVYNIMEMRDAKSVITDESNSNVYFSHIFLSIVSRRDVATFVNSYPTLDVAQELVKGEYTAGLPSSSKLYYQETSTKEMSKSGASGIGYNSSSSSPHSTRRTENAH